jgi:hypothetical protein
MDTTRTARRLSGTHPLLVSGSAALTGLLLVAAALAVSTRPSDARPHCPDEAEHCAGEPGPDDTVGPPPPTPQPQPPAPYGTPRRFAYDALDGLALGVDAAIATRLAADPPASNVAWPLSQIPYSPAVSSDPVSVRSVAPGVWAFASFASNGRAFHCVGQCSSVPEVVFNPNYGTYQATLRIEPKLDVALFMVAQGAPIQLARFTVHLQTRAFAECVGWENGNGVLNARSGVGDIKFNRGTGVIEDIADFFVPGFSASVNARIRSGLLTQVGVGQFSTLPMHGGPCATLGVAGDASTGAIQWNPEPWYSSCRIPGCEITGGPIFHQ